MAWHDAAQVGGSPARPSALDPRDPQGQLTNTEDTWVLKGLLSFSQKGIWLLEPESSKTEHVDN